MCDPPRPVLSVALRVPRSSDQISVAGHRDARSRAGQGEADYADQETHLERARSHRSGVLRFLYAKRLQLPAKKLQIPELASSSAGRKPSPLAPLNVQSDEADIASARDRKRRSRLPVFAAPPFAIDQPILNRLADQLTNVELNRARHRLSQDAGQSGPSRRHLVSQFARDRGR